MYSYVYCVLIIIAPTVLVPVLALALLRGSSCYGALFTFRFGAALRHGQWPIRCTREELLCAARGAHRWRALLPGLWYNLRLPSNWNNTHLLRLPCASPPLPLFIICSAVGPQSPRPRCQQTTHRIHIHIHIQHTLQLCQLPTAAPMAKLKKNRKEGESGRQGPTASAVQFN